MGPPSYHAFSYAYHSFQDFYLLLPVVPLKFLLIFTHKACCWLCSIGITQMEGTLHQRAQRYTVPTHCCQWVIRIWICVRALKFWFNITVITYPIQTHNGTIYIAPCIDVIWLWCILAHVEGNHSIVDNKRKSFAFLVQLWRLLHIESMNYKWSPWKCDSPTIALTVELW